MNDQFFSLPEEKQLRILNAAMEVFALNDYKRASTDLIAAKAGVSKGLLFYYFHNKKELYLYLYDYVKKIMTEQVVDQQFKKITDFFELLAYSSMRKVEMLKKNPYILEFAVQTFYSEKEAVSDDLNQINTEQVEALYASYFQGMDWYKFKEGVEPVKLYKMLVWMADGYMHEQKMADRELNLDVLMEEFQQWSAMFKKIVYKEEYQDGNH